MVKKKKTLAEEVHEPFKDIFDDFFKDTFLIFCPSINIDPNCGL